MQKHREATLELCCDEIRKQMPRLQRIELLEMEEREMAYKLARTGLAAKDERQLLAQMRRLELQKQSKIMECANALKEFRR